MREAAVADALKKAQGKAQASKERRERIRASAMRKTQNTFGASKARPCSGFCIHDLSLRAPPNQLTSRSAPTAASSSSADPRVPRHPRQHRRRRLPSRTLRRQTRTQISSWTTLTLPARAGPGAKAEARHEGVTERSAGFQREFSRLNGLRSLWPRLHEPAGAPISDSDSGSDSHARKKEEEEDEREPIQARVFGSSAGSAALGIALSNRLSFSSTHPLVRA